MYYFGLIIHFYFRLMKAYTTANHYCTISYHILSKFAHEIYLWVVFFLIDSRELKFNNHFIILHWKVWRKKINISSRNSKIHPKSRSSCTVLEILKKNWKKTIVYHKKKIDIVYINLNFQPYICVSYKVITQKHKLFNHNSGRPSGSCGIY